MSSMLALVTTARQWLSDCRARARGRRNKRGTLFRKYVALLLGVVSIALLGNGLFTVWLSYHENRSALFRIQLEQADAVASKISQFFKEIEAQLGWTTQLPWSAAGLEQRRFDALRLLRQVPAITELSQIDENGLEQLRVSRLAMDVVGSHIDVSREPKFSEALSNEVYYGAVYFRRESEPYMTLAMSGTRRDAGVSVAEVNLKFIWEVIAHISVGKTGHAFVVDERGRLVAHTDISLVLRGTDVSKLQQVRRSLETRGSSEPRLIEVASDFHGQRVITAHAAVPSVGWQVFVELPTAEAYAPLYASMVRFFVLLLSALVLAALTALFLARHMMAPIRLLGSGAARIGGGDLSHRISIKTGDELEVLGEQFNDMASRLEGSYETLEQRVRERTQQLALANSAQRRFLAVASHDLRQPLHAMGLFIAQLRNATDPAEREQLVERSDAAVTLMNELFDALLDLSQLDAGVLVPRPTDLPIKRVLDRLETTFGSIASEKGLDLRIVPSSAWVRSDPILLERILLNLVSNAVRHTERGVAVVGCRRRGAALQIEVWDSGPGIPAEQRENIFSEYVRLTPSETEQQRGLGLGLAIVRRLCELLGHELALESREGKGSCFSVRVPLGIAALPAQLSARNAAGILSSFDGQLVSLIDDDALVLDSTRRLLGGWGCSVVTSTSATQALTDLALHGRPPNLIIADFNLSYGMTGLAAIEAVRARFALAIPAFLISAEVTPERLRELRAAGYQLLRKPVSPVMLRAMMLSILKQAEPTASPTDQARVRT